MRLVFERVDCVKYKFVSYVYTSRRKEYRRNMNIPSVISEILAFREGMYQETLLYEAIGHASPATFSMLFPVNSR